MEYKNNITAGVIAGLVAAIICAGIWAGITIATGYQIGWVAIGVGFAVGTAVRIAGEGDALPFGIAGAVLALLGCALGNLISIMHFIADDQGLSFMEVFTTLGVGGSFSVLVDSFEAMDALFYGLALYFGFTTSMVGDGAEHE